MALAGFLACRAQQIAHGSGYLARLADHAPHVVFGDFEFNDDFSAFVHFLDEYLVLRGNQCFGYVLN